MAIDYFTIEEFRALPKMSDDAVYPTERVEDAAAHVISVIDREIFGDVNGQLVGFTLRSITEVLSGDGSGTLVLGTPHAREITSLRIGGTTTSFASMILEAGMLRYGYTSGGTWTQGIGNIAVTYTAGYSPTPPADIKEVAMQATRARLLSTNSNADYSDRRTSLTTDQGTISYVVAGQDRPTGYPEVDAVILGWKERLSIPGFA